MKHTKITNLCHYFYTEASFRKKKRLHQAQKDFFVFKLKKTQKFSEKNLLISKLFANFVVKLNFATNAKFLMIWKLLI